MNLSATKAPDRRQRNVHCGVTPPRGGAGERFQLFIYHIICHNNRPGNRIIMATFRIVLTDDHTLIRSGLREVIEQKADLKVVGEAADGFQVLDLLKKLKADLVILDISMPNMRGIEAATKIKAMHPTVKILILTMHKDKEYLQQALSMGVDGYLLKEDPPAELFSAIEKIRRGKFYVSPSLTGDLLNIIEETRGGSNKSNLTNREIEILRLIARGKSSNEIAKDLLVSIHTVERHRANIKTKLNLKRTADLVRYAIEKGYI